MQKTIIINGVMANEDDCRRFMADYYWYNTIRKIIGAKPLLVKKEWEIGNLIFIETEGL